MGTLAIRTGVWGYTTVYLDREYGEIFVLFNPTSMVARIRSVTFLRSRKASNEAYRGWATVEKRRQIFQIPKPLTIRSRIHLKQQDP